MASTVIVTHIAYSLHASSIKVQTLVLELLAAICFLSQDSGHKMVLGAMSDFKIVYEETFRFETLIALLRLRDLYSDTESIGEGGLGNEEEGVWEVRTAAMTFLNALINCPEALEDRLSQREELGRRGLNEIIVVCVDSSTLRTNTL